MTISPDKTDELNLADLMPVRPGAPPPVPGVGPGTVPPPLVAVLAPPASVPPPHPRRSTPEPLTVLRHLRKPWRRLLKAYVVTTGVVLSYIWIAVQRRFRSQEAIERLVEEAHRRNARRVEAAIVELQGLFIKVGQLISIMANFLPEAFREGLQGLQDHVPPRPYDDIEARLCEEFGGRGPTQVFAEFEREPIASASIGQVHRARLPTGEQVAVKIQYPDIEEIVRTDLRALRRLFGLLAWWLPGHGFDTMYREIRETVLAELDYSREAEAIVRIGGHFQGRLDVLFPRVMTAFSTGRVLTTEWMTGTKAADLDALASAGVDRRKAARLVVEAYCQQIFIDGMYHADPHPGNLLLRPGGPGAPGPALVFLDFGATAQVSDGMRKGLISFLQGAMTRDSSRIVAAMKEMGFISRNADTEVFDRVVEHFHEKFREQVRIEGFSLKDIKFEPEKNLASLLDLRELNVSLADLRDAFHVPREWVMLERTLLLLLGVCTTLDPEMNPAGIIQPYVERFLLGEKKEWSDAVLEAGREAALSALALPGEIGRFITVATRGDMEMRVRHLDDSTRAVYTLGHQLLWAFLGAVALGRAVVFDGRGQMVGRRWSVTGAIVCGLLLLSNLWKGRGQMKRRR